MKELTCVLVAFALLTGATLYAEREGDRQCLVSPPDRRTEEFLREIENERWSCAREYLVNPDAMSEAGMRALHDRMGEPAEIHAQLLAIDDYDARTRLLGMEFELVYDDGWKISSGRRGRSPLRTGGLKAASPPTEGLSTWKRVPRCYVVSRA